MKRRALLAAAAGASVGLAGCGGREPESEPEPWGEPPPADRPNLDDVADAWGIDEVVDLEEHGVDPFGTEPIEGTLEEVAADGRLLYLPPGRYRLEETWEFTEFDSFGLVSDGATVVPEEGFDDEVIELGAPGTASRLLVEGLRFDFRADRTGGRPIVARVDDDLLLRDVSVSGRQDVDTDTVRVDVASPDGVGRIERLRLPDGAVAMRPGITGCEVGDDTRGDLTFADCHVEGFSDNGLYADPPEGRVRVLGGYYANNDVASVRVNADAGSIVRGVHVRCDEPRQRFENMRGIRLRGGDDVLVEDCLVEMLAVTESDGGVTFSTELTSATMRDSHVHVDADGVNAIRIKHAQESRGLFGRGGSFRVENVTVTGSAATGAAIQANERDDCVFEGLCVHQTGRNRTGVSATRVNGAIRDAHFAVTDRPYRFTNSNIETTDVSVRRLRESGARSRGGCGT
ncbi:right-handed parallel beta-helix repeat-containing protein [Halorarum salinum]|uniref:Right-handed parallel beta-helix repeat-containing protein n=1 Tax=Halorarum salinum TaxID=2743089 RepID=A0A7D5LEL8_9EURY|nr:right-handed parallel beta-helix repeat-containing protein [Halobaculum salinum]QLG64135.1 right-handed parallel beta-helix repeat-containing protein [Halobaculum salinum]